MKVNQGHTILHKRIFTKHSELLRHRLLSFKCNDVTRADT